MIKQKLWGQEQWSEKRKEGRTLLALKIEEGAMSRGKQLAPGMLKRKRVLPQRLHKEPELSRSPQEPPC